MGGKLYITAASRMLAAAKMRTAASILRRKKMVWCSHNETFCVTACWSRVSPLVMDGQIGLLTFINHSALI
jgi:hypothetical protein